MTYYLNIGISLCVYCLLVQSYAMWSARAGLVSLMQGASLAVGAYAGAIMSTRAGLPFVIDLAVGLAAGTIFGLISGWVLTKVRTEDFMLATITVQGIVLGLIGNGDAVTNGMRGIAGIPTPGFYGADPQATVLLCGFAATCVVWIVAGRFAASPTSALLDAVRENELFALSIGCDAPAAKRMTIVTACATAGIAGAIYAHQITFVGPDSFGIAESVFILSASILAGVRSPIRSALAASFMVLAPELLRFLGLPTTVAAGVRDAIFGCALVWTMVISSPKSPGSMNAPLPPNNARDLP